MGTGEEGTPSKTTKPPPSSQMQEVPTTPSYADWSNSMQAYYGAGATPPPFFASTVASPTPHPYLWGGQHHLIPPYGTPVPYPAMYPPGGVYAHPNMTMTPGMVQTSTEPIGRHADGKDRASAKKPKGTAGNMSSAGVKVADGGKVASGSGNDAASHSGESGSEGSSDASDENANQQEFGASKKGSFDQMLAEAGANAQHNTTGSNMISSRTGKPVGSVPATNLNIGMDLWNTSPACSGAAKDERELKRQKRKQSNRESARRSRLRKQAECEELQARVQTLSNENRTLRDELQRLSEECEKLTSENSSIKEELTRLCGPDALANLEPGNPASALSRGDEGNS